MKVSLKVFHRVVLKTNQYETKAYQSKIVCLIKMEKFQDVLNDMRKTPPSVVGCIVKGSEEEGSFFCRDLAFEKAYCEYRLNKNEEAMQTLKGAEGGDDVRKLELLAQLLYR